MRMHTRFTTTLIACSATALVASGLYAAAPANAVQSAKPTCTITGTGGGDVLTGTEGDDVICGRGGDDRIDGRGGDDVIHGGAGDDHIDGRAGDDDLHGGAGDDDLDGGAGDDELDAGNGGNVTLRLRIRSASVKGLVVNLVITPNTFNADCVKTIGKSKSMPTPVIDPWLPQEFVLFATDSKLKCSGSDQPLYEFFVNLQAGAGNFNRLVTLRTGDAGDNNVVVGCKAGGWKCQLAYSTVVDDNLVMYLE